MSDHRVDVFLRKSDWTAPLAALRAILTSEGLTEGFKWRQPCYAHAGRNVAIISGRKDHCVLSFFRGAFLEDPEGHLAFPGPNSRYGKLMEFRTAAEVEAAGAVIRGFIAQAREIAEAPEPPQAAPADDPHPVELTEALARDPDLAAAFDALTPGRQRGWLLQFNGAKKSETRATRVAKATPAIRAGKGPHDR